MENKILNAFSRISLHVDYDNDSPYDCLNFEDDCKLVENALQELDDIKNANPSKALKDLEIIGSVCPEEDVSAKEIFYEEYDNVKQYILKAQEQGNALEIIIRKNVDIYWLKVKYSVDEYNRWTYKDELTQEEFDLLKEVVK